MAEPSRDLLLAVSSAAAAARDAALMLPAVLQWELEPAAVSAVDGALAGADDDAVGAEPVVQLLLPLLAMLRCCCPLSRSGS